MVGSDRHAARSIPAQIEAGMGGAVDRVTGSKRTILAVQHPANGKRKIVELCSA
ncbi:MAG: hypothetical protein ACXW2I_18630 [Burkholderiales bacterium]